jgi:GT2 family glycosyltransferase
MVTLPFLSVIMPTYNRHASLQEALHCVFCQTYPPTRYEVIVVDDGSHDETPALLHQLARQGRLRWYQQANAGPAAARNAGASMARGDVLVFTDDDCRPESGWLAALAASYTAAEGEVPAGVGGRLSQLDRGHWLHRFDLGQAHEPANACAAPNYLDTANASYQRAVFQALGGFREQVYTCPGGEDVDLGLRCRAAGHRLTTNCRAVVWHVGRTSLRGLLKQAWQRGQGDALLHVLHPTVFAAPPGSRLRQRVHHIFGWLRQCATYAPTRLRPLARATIAAGAAALLALVEMEQFARHAVPRQRARYRAQIRSRGLVCLYMALEWVYSTLRLVGRVVGVFRATYEHVQEAQR